MNTWSITLMEFWTATASHLWQSTLVLILLGLLALTLRKAPGRIRNGLWQIGLAKMAIPFSLFGWLFHKPVLETVSDSAAVVLVSGFLNPMVLSNPPATTGSGSILLVLVTALWAATALWLLVRGVAGWTPKRYRQFIAPSDLDPAVRERLMIVLERTGMKPHHVQLMRNSRIPGVSGFLRPKIHLSIDLLQSLDDESLQAVLLHEEAHRRRYEPMRYAIQRVIFCLFFYFPPLWLLLRYLHDTAELACDEAALDQGTSPDTYLAAFRKVIALDLAPATSLAAMAGARPSHFARRFYRIRSYERRTVMLKHRIALLAGLAILCISFFAVGVLEAEQGMTTDENHPAWRQLEGLNGTWTPVMLTFRDTELDKIFKTLGDAGRFEVEITRGMARKVTASFGQTTVGEALIRLAAERGLHYTVENPGKLIVHTPLLPGVGGVTTPTRLEYSYAQPAYPEPARQDRVEGTVILQVVIGEDGSIGNMLILRSAPEEYGFEDAAMEAVGQWRYNPATRDGIPVPVYLTIHIQFSLQ